MGFLRFQAVACILDPSAKPRTGGRHLVASMLLPPAAINLETHANLASDDIDNSKSGAEQSQGRVSAPGINIMCHTIGSRIRSGGCRRPGTWFRARVGGRPLAAAAS